MSKQARVSVCDVCNGMLKKTYRDRTSFHACSPCHNMLALMDMRAKQIFGE